MALLVKKRTYGNGVERLDPTKNTVELTLDKTDAGTVTCKDIFTEFFVFKGLTRS
jgi:hypothetical protein